MRNPIEFCDYPFIPGQGGIPMDVIRKIGDGDSEEDFTGGSGRRLHFRARENHFEIYDTSIWDNRHLSASLFGETLSFSLFSRRRKLLGRGWSSQHPDMYAREFVGLTIWYFETDGRSVKSILDSWYPGSMNYSEYKTEVKKDGDKLRAALSTRSGQIYPRWGYLLLAEDAIHDIEDSYYGPKVSAKFTHPENVKHIPTFHVGS